MSDDPTATVTITDEAGDSGTITVDRDRDDVETALLTLFPDAPTEVRVACTDLADAVLNGGPDRDALETYLAVRVSTP